MSEDQNILSQDDIDSLLTAEEKSAEVEAVTPGAPEAVVGEDLIEDGTDQAEAVQTTKAEEKMEKESETLSSTDPDEYKLDEVEDSENEEESDAIISSAPSAESFTAGVSGGKAYQRDIDFIMDIPLQLRVEVGRTKVTIASLLSYGPGAVVELEKLAGEPLDIFVNDKLIARGEAIVVNDKFGVRLTDVVSKSERIENLT